MALLDANRPVGASVRNTLLRFWLSYVVAGIGVFSLLGCSDSASSHLLSDPCASAMPDIACTAPLLAASRDSIGSTETRFGARYMFLGAPSGEMDSVGEGQGFGLSICYKSTATATYGDDIVLVVMIEQSEHEDGSSNAALYRRILAGFRWLDPASVNFETYLALGGGYHAIDISGGNDFSGAGAYVGVGIEVMIATPVSVYAEAILHAFWADQEGAADGQFGSVALGAALRF